MKTDREIYTLLGADAETLAILTDGIRVRGPYRFEALEVKGLDRRTDGVLLPEAPEETGWVIEFQAQADPNIYHRTVVELGLVGERNPGRVVRGLILFATAALDPQTEPWHSAAQQPNPPLRVACLQPILEALERREPAHPLLAVFLPWQVADQERLRREGPAALARITGAALPRQVRANLTDVFFSWLTVRFSHLSYREILTMLGIQTSFEETRAYQDILAIGHEQGLAEGREKGRAEGRRQEAADLLLRQARRRFGPLAPELEVRLDALPLTRLEALAEAIFDLNDQSDLREWIGKP